MPTHALVSLCYPIDVVGYFAGLWAFKCEVVWFEVGFQWIMNHFLIISYI